MSNPGIEIAKEFLWNFGTFLVLLAWILWSSWRIWKAFMDVHSRWGRWHTFPVPDKKAINHMVALFALVGVNALLTWFGIMWFL